jgi:hypothetical protein
MGYPDRLNPEFFTGLWSHVIETGRSLCFIDERDGEARGFLLGMVGPDLYSGRPTALEQFWYVRKTVTGLGASILAMKLLEAFNLEAQVRGCVRAFVGHWHSGPNLARVYGRLGYRELETHFVKEL